MHQKHYKIVFQHTCLNKRGPIAQSTFRVIIWAKFSILMGVNKDRQKQRETLKYEHLCLLSGGNQNFSVLSSKK